MHTKQGVGDVIGLAGVECGHHGVACFSREAVVALAIGFVPCKGGEKGQYGIGGGMVEKKPG